jgi:hypothetical protein
MFCRCTSLNHVKVKFTDWNDSNNSTYEWLYYVPSTGTFVCPTGLNTTQRGDNYIPKGWTIQKD